MTSKAIRSATGSLESRAGRSPSNSPVLRQLRLFGPARVPANRIPQRAKDAVIAMSGICGRSFTGSSASAALSASLASRLKTRLDTVGSMEYRQTWKEKVTPSGRLYLAHTARARRTSDKDCSGEVSGWPTPTKSDTTGGKQPSGGTRTTPSKLKQMPTVLTGWPSPTRQDSVRMPSMNFTTPNITLNHAATLTGWATPAARDFKSEAASETYNHERDAHPRGKPLSYEALGATTASSPAATAKRGASVLNAAMSRWLQGFPASWDTASPSYAEWQSVQQELTESAG